MVRITDEPIACRDAFGAAGVALPGFDIAAARALGRQEPRWLHIGPGNLFRALHAQLAQTLLDGGRMAGGVIVAGTLWPGEIAQVYAPSDDRHLLVVMKPDGGLDTTLIASVARAIYAGPDGGDLAALLQVAAAPSLQLVTVTITEKGYVTRDAGGDWLPAVAADVAGGPGGATSAMGILTACLHARWAAGGAPIALVSTDNFSANGDRFRAAVSDVARTWADGGQVEAAFADYVAGAKVSFPCTMIDRITPNPSQDVADKLTAAGVADMELIRVSASTVMAPFANTEPTWYLVVEDDFPNGRPPLEATGVLMTDRSTVNLTDEMKVTACLNPLHTALAVFGMLLGFDRIWQEMRDPDLVALVRRLGFDEMLPVCPDPGIIEPADFLGEVIDRRLPNPALPDAPGRIAADTSQKLPIRFGTALGRYAARGAAVGGLTAIPLVLAGWLRYLMGVDDAGHPMTLSPDPRLDELTVRLSGLRLGADNSAVAREVGVPLLSQVVGADLTQLADRIVEDLQSLTRGPGAVRATLHAAAGGAAQATRAN